MTKVWIVCKWNEYEGYEEPHMVFSSLEKAQAYVAPLNPIVFDGCRDYCKFGYDIFEKEIE